MLLIHESLVACGEPSTFLNSALEITRAVCQRHSNAEASFISESVSLSTVEHGRTSVTTRHVALGEGETIVKGSTINNYEFAPRRWANHGLVYADYYFLLVVNKLLAMEFWPLPLREQAMHEGVGCTIRKRNGDIAR